MGLEGVEPPSSGNSDFSIAGAEYNEPLYDRPVNNLWNFF